MANSYTDVPEIKFHMEHPLMKRIVELKERNYADYGQYDYAPKDQATSTPTSSVPILRMSMLKALTARTAACAMPARLMKTSTLPSRLVSAA